jgi:glycine betaine/proline transport system ATP-binding protein
MKDGVIKQIGTPEQIVMEPADDYVREFVQGISKLKLVKAHSIMEPIGDFSGSLQSAPRIDHDAYLDQLIDLSVISDEPIIVARNGTDIGVVTKACLLRGIQGGRND